MDGEKPVVGEQEHNHLEKVADVIRADGELFRWVAVGIEVHNDDRVTQGMADSAVADAVPSS